LHQLDGFTQKENKTGYYHYMCGDTTETIQYSPKDQQFQQMVSRFLEEYAHQTGTTTVGMIMEHKENKANQTSF